jgi:phage host-nuclease inhibitor protein Gam
MNKPNRTQQTAVLKRAQELRKQETQEKVFEAIRQLQQENKPITFPNIARIADVSISYLYKWPQVKDYIQSLRDTTVQKKNLTVENNEPGPHSLRTLHEVARRRIKELESSVEELKRQNQLLRGHIADVHELREECDRLRQRVMALTNANSSSQVAVFNSKPLASQTADCELLEEVAECLRQAGITPTIRLKREIHKHSVESVQDAIAAFIEYRSGKIVEKPVACLLAMIRDEAKPNGRLSEQCQNIDSECDSQGLRSEMPGMESLEVENEWLKKQNQHLMKRLTIAQSEQRSEAAVAFAKEREKAKGHLQGSEER